MQKKARKANLLKKPGCSSMRFKRWQEEDIEWWRKWWNVS
jgi:hypothetical protein